MRFTLLTEENSSSSPGSFTAAGYLVAETRKEDTESMGNHPLLFPFALLLLILGIVLVGMGITKKKHRRLRIFGGILMLYAIVFFLTIPICYPTGGKTAEGGFWDGTACVTGWNTFVGDLSWWNLLFSGEWLRP
jgi:hypothetical protein